MSERIQKVLANVGLGSRRTIEKWISEGRITVDGELAKLGVKVTDESEIQVDGRLIEIPKVKSFKRRVILYSKPEGEICTRTDPEGRPTVYENLPKLSSGRWISIGRLDISTQGLLLFTNDGDYANKQMHPSSDIEREYAVRVFGNVNDNMLTRLHQGVELDDGMASFKQIIDAGGSGRNHWFHVTVHDGRNRIVRRLWESQGLTISRLIRIRFGNIKLPSSLQSGRYIEL